jgi:hypothetical protein
MTNIGKDLENVEFNSYRNEPNTQTKYGLSISGDHHKKFKHGMVIDFKNFPIAVNSNELQVEISLHGKPHSKEVQGRNIRKPLLLPLLNKRFGSYLFFELACEFRRSKIHFYSPYKIKIVPTSL